MSSDCFILPGDHIFDDGVLPLLGTADTLGSLVLAVGTRGRNFDCVEAKTVKVRLDKNTMQILEIGRDLDCFNAVDTGAYLWHPDIRVLLREYLSRPWHKTRALSGFTNFIAMQIFTSAIDVGDMKWIDIDMEQDYLLADRLWGKSRR